MHDPSGDQLGMLGFLLRDGHYGGRVLEADVLLLAAGAPAMADKKYVGLLADYLLRRCRVLINLPPQNTTPRQPLPGT